MSSEDFLFAMFLIQAIIIAIGLIGNIISIIVFSRKTFRNNSISTYCISLAIFECLPIFELIIDIIQLMYKVNLTDQNDTSCKSIIYIMTIMSPIQACLLVAFSIDKLLSMKSVQIIKKKWFQYSIVGGIVLINALAYIYLPILLRRIEIYPGYYYCDLSTIGFFKEYMIINLLESGLLPFTIMSITSILSIRLLIKSRNSVEKVNGQVMKERRSKDRKFAISSITFNILFIVLKLPIIVFFTLSAFYSYYDLYVFRIALLLYYLNFSSSFFVHFSSNSLFRREFTILFLRFGKRNADSGITNTLSRINRVNPMSDVAI